MDGGSVDHWTVGNHWGVGNDWAVGNHWVRNWVCFGEVGNTVVLDIGDIATRAVRVGGVGDNLGTAIRKSNPVVAGHNLGIRGLCCAESSAAVGVLDTVLKSVRLGSNVNGVSGMDGGGVVSLRGSGGGGQDGGGSDEGLHFVVCC